MIYSSLRITEISFQKTLLVIDGSPEVAIDIEQGDTHSGWEQPHWWKKFAARVLGGEGS